MSTIAQDRPGLRWSGSLGIVLALHALTVIAVLWWRTHTPLPAPPAAPTTVMVELAPLPSAPPAPPTEQPPGPPQTVQRRAAAETEPPPPRPVPEPPQPATAALPQTPAEPSPRRPDTTRDDHRDDGDADSTIADSRAPPNVAATPANHYAAAETLLGSGQTHSDWNAQILGRLDHFKRYPRVAQRRRQQGTARVRFSVDRQGRVLDVTLSSSSGHPALDAEALATVHRASPLPAPPAGIVGDPVEVTTPVEFNLR